MIREELLKLSKEELVDMLLHCSGRTRRRGLRPNRRRAIASSGGRIPSLEARNPDMTGIRGR